jgi:hypothetical protein
LSCSWVLAYSPPPYSLPPALSIIASILQPSRDDPKRKAAKTCWWWYTCFASPLTYLQKSLHMIASRNAHNRPDALPRLFDASEMSQSLDALHNLSRCCYCDQAIFLEKIEAGHEHVA